jgi:hypothetical protein
MSCGNARERLSGVQRVWKKKKAKFICFRTERMMAQKLEITLLTACRIVPFENLTRCIFIQ